MKEQTVNTQAQGDYPVLPEPWAKNGYAGIVYYTADKLRAALRSLGGEKK